MDRKTRRYLARIGSRGGSRSRRRLDPDVAREMVKIREARRAMRRFHALCFWSYDPDMPVKARDIPWVVEQLRKHGNREAWEVADRLCH